MERPRLGSPASRWLLLLLLCLLIQSLGPCFSIDDEGRMLLRLGEGLEVDPFGALSDGVAGEDAAGPCDGFGVECENGKVIALNHETATVRKLLRTKEGGRKSRKPHSPSPSPAPSPTLPASPLFRKASQDPPTLSSTPSPSPSATSQRKGLPPSTSHPSSPDRDLTPLPSPSPSPSRSPSPSPVPMLENLPSSNGSRSVPTPTSSSSPSPSEGDYVKASHSKNNMVLFVGVGAGSFGLLAFMTICIHYYRVKKVVTVKPWTTGLSGQLQKAFVTGVPQLKRPELETACEDFSNIIGSLSDCILYKGTLSSGVEIAVASTLITSAKDWSKHSEAQFRNKIATLSKVNHKNFVNHLGYCEEEEPFTRMLVFEYAPNGTLFEHLHVKEAEDLDWAARLRIGMGIAYCLDHMHQLNPPVILRNLQSSSIYLTDDLAAKIADFDFSSETTMVAVTASGGSGPFDKRIPAPEIIVYNFGILLLEIVSGRFPYPEDNGSLSEWASDYLMGSSHLRDVVDPSLKTFRDEDLQAMGEVICRCCDPEPQDRPTMKEIAARLRDITAVPPDGAVPRSSALWWAELEILSTEAN